MAPGQPLTRSVLPREGAGFLPLWHERGVCKQTALHRTLRETCWHGGSTLTFEAGLALSLFYVSKSSACLCCFSWWLQHQDAMDKSVWTSISGGWHSDDLCHPPWSSPSLGLVIGAWYPQPLGLSQCTVLYSTAGFKTESKFFLKRFCFGRIHVHIHNYGIRVISLMMSICFC